MNDGDQSLVVADELFVKIAKRNMNATETREAIVPLYYEMGMSNPDKISRESIYIGMTNAYSGGNIGAISNNITKVWNSENPDLDIIKLMCLESNFVIDYAKTLFKPDRPQHVHDKMVQYTKKKVPYFFMYAKGKKRYQVEAKNNSGVNQLSNIIPDDEIVFKNTNVGEFDYKKLLSKNNQCVKFKNYRIIREYKKLDLHKYFLMNYSDDKENNSRHLYQEIREKLLVIESDVDIVVNTLVKYLYIFKNSSYKATLWECFGEELVRNLEHNIGKPLNDGWIQCEVCGKRVAFSNNKTLYCKKCSQEIKKRQNKVADLRYRLKNTRK